jgi:hypothetical protein
LTCGGGFYSPDLPTLGVAPPASNEPFLSQNLTGGAIITRGGYILQMSAAPYGMAPGSCNGLGGGQSGQAYKAAADPADPATNFRYFATNANGVIFEDSASLWAAMPEVGEPATGHLLR